LKSILQFVDRQPAPSLLPILRSQQQGEISANTGNCVEVGQVAARDTKNKGNGPAADRGFLLAVQEGARLRY
jgi:Domain of unknown function (DUF397)